MFCIYCGKEVSDDSEFCYYCGEWLKDGTSTSNIEKINDQVIAEEDEIEEVSAYKKLACPRCASTKCQPTVHTTTHTQSGGYSCCAGGCGGLLLGPLGLLLGLCGSGSSASTTTQTKWHCMNCGKEFMSLDDARKAINSQMAASITLTLLGAIFFVFIGIFSLSAATIFGAIMVIGAFVCWFAVPENAEKTTGYLIDDLMETPEYEQWKRKCIYFNLAIIGSAIVLEIIICSMI